MIDTDLLCVIIFNGRLVSKESNRVVCMLCRCVQKRHVQEVGVQGV